MPFQIIWMKFWSQSCNLWGGCKIFARYSYAGLFFAFWEKLDFAENAETQFFPLKLDFPAILHKSRYWLFWYLTSENCMWQLFHYFVLELYWFFESLEGQDLIWNRWNSFKKSLNSFSKPRNSFSKCRNCLVPHFLCKCLDGFCTKNLPAIARVLSPSGVNAGPITFWSKY